MEQMSIYNGIKTLIRFLAIISIVGRKVVIMGKSLMLERHAKPEHAILFGRPFRTQRSISQQPLIPMWENMRKALSPMKLFILQVLMKLPLHVADQSGGRK